MLSKKSYISINQDIQDGWIWQDKPFSYGQAWISIILMARGCKSYKSRGEVIKCKQGSFITSETKMSEEFGWGRTRLRNFLEMLVEDEKILMSKNSKQTSITICDYSSYVKVRTAHKQGQQLPNKPNPLPSGDLQETTNHSRTEDGNNIIINNNNIMQTDDQKEKTRDEKAELRAQLVSMFKELVPVTRRDYSRLNGLVKDFYKKKATPIRMMTIVRTWKKNWPDVDPTPEGMLKHWEKLKNMYLKEQKGASVVESA